MISLFIRQTDRCSKTRCLAEAFRNSGKNARKEIYIHRALLALGSHRMRYTVLNCIWQYSQSRLVEAGEKKETLFPNIAPLKYSIRGNMFPIIMFLAGRQ
jgi:hypothetical protein